MWIPYNGGLLGDQNLFTVRQIITAPAGQAPAGIGQIIPQCYWEMSTVLSAINTDITFNAADAGIQGINDPSALRILTRTDAAQPWTVYPDQTLVDNGHIRANNAVSAGNVSGLGQFALGLAAALPPSTTLVETSVSPSVFGQSIILTATVSGNGGTPTGTVQFQDNEQPLGAPAALVNGAATFNISSC
jgi:hypothetical protein